MGHRTLKRVPLKFDWPLNKAWEGYLNPYYKACRKCVPCGGLGYSPDGKFLHDSWYRHIASSMFGAFSGSNILATWSREKLLQSGWSKEVADNIERARKFGFKTLTHWSDKLDEQDVKALVDDGRLWDFTSTWTPGKGWEEKNPPVIPTPDQVNAWSGQGMGHDSLNAGVCIEARCKRLGISHMCAECKGSGEIWPTPEIKMKADRWRSKEPPKGAGWQLWETVSEGSPITPVFKTPGELAKYCAAHGCMGPDSKLSEQQILKMLRGDVEELEVGSLMLVVPGQGVTTVAENQMGEPSPRDWMPDKK